MNGTRVVAVETVKVLMCDYILRRAERLDSYSVVCERPRRVRDDSVRFLHHVHELETLGSVFRNNYGVITFIVFHYSILRAIPKSTYCEPFPSQ